MSSSSSTSAATAARPEVAPGDEQDGAYDPCPPPKKRKKKATAEPDADEGEGESSTSAAVKKKQPNSCDACRARKVKCHRDAPLPEGVDLKGPDVPRCLHCASLGVPCTYIYVPKKRGPPNQYLKRMQEQQQQQAEAEAARAAGGGGGSAGWQSTQEGGQTSVSPPIPSSSLSSTAPFKFEPELDRSLASGRPSWALSPAPGGDEPAASQTLFAFTQPRLFSSFAGSGSSLGNRTSTFDALTLPPIEPSPPVSPFALASSSACLRPTLPTRSASMSMACDSASRPTLRSLVHSPGFESSALSAGTDSLALDLGSPSTIVGPSPRTQHSHPAAQHDANVTPAPPYHTSLSDERNASVSQWMRATSLLDAPQREPTGGRSTAGGAGARGEPFEAAKSDNADTPRLSLYSDGTPRKQRIEDVLPRDVAVYVISLFFDFVWVLTPCLHKATFMADLTRRREETDPLFFALVMSTLASTLLQVPKIQIPVPSGEVRALAAKCFRASRNVSLHYYDPPTFLMVIIRYFDTTFQYISGNRGANTTSFVEAVEIAIQLGLNSEHVYAGLDPIETELRRRVFFLLFDADKSMGCLLGRILTLRREDITAVALPTEVDDACLTREAYLPQPAGKTPLITGFNLNTRTFALLATVLEAQRGVARLPKPIEPSEILRRLRDVGGMSETALTILDEVPPAFRPRQPFDSACNSPAADWGESAMNQIQEYFTNPSSSQDDAKDAYQVSQGNIYVTMAWVRHLIVDYRAELLQLSGGPGTPARKAAESVCSELEGARDTRETIALDLLSTLHSIPILSLAVNGPSLVEKTRFVAATFFETPSSETDEARARVSNYLFEFLTVLSEIEKNFAQ